MHSDPITAEDMQMIGPWLMNYNEPAKTVTVLAWSSGCFVKEMLRCKGVKYPHLYMIGEAGSGKSTTMERIVQPIFGIGRSVAAPQVTGFTLMKESASSNIFPQTLDEFKPSKIFKTRLDALSNHLRDTYDGHEGIRGKADMTQVSYALLAPLAVAGEEAPEEPAVRERGMEILFSKKDLKEKSSREAFGNISSKTGQLTRMGRLLLETVLILNTETVYGWYQEAWRLFNPDLPSRIINNMACCMAGLRLMETALDCIGLSWDQVYSIPLEMCAKWLEIGVQEYLLDGGTSNRTVVEQTLEIIDRMGLTDEECRFLKDDQVALYFKGFYDRFTRYIRENAIMVEHLQYNQFMKQLRKSALYVETKPVRMGGGELRKVVILNFAEMQRTCEVEGFLKSQAAAL
jgi:ABC-type dipeptide/oligopeptide/nickel transport system ATPase component